MSAWACYQQSEHRRLVNTSRLPAPTLAGLAIFHACRSPIGSVAIRLSAKPVLCSAAVGVRYQRFGFVLDITATRVIENITRVAGMMADPKLSKLELQIMETLWTRGEVSIREIQESFLEKSRPSYGTIQITIYRMEEKKIVHRTRKVGNFHLFAPLISRDAAQLRLIDELVAMFGGRSQLVMMHLVRSGKLKLEDVKEAERELKRLERKDKSL
jgi:BlaI family transcriptional regulator, penicillinase repressor